MFGVLRRLLPVLLASSISMSAWLGNTPPDSANAARLNNLGVAYMNQQRMDKAVEEFDLALKADPGLTAAELNKGIALLNLQKLPEAEEALNGAAAREPSNPRAWYNLGLLRRSQGKPAEAIEAFQRVLKIDPNDPDAHYFLGTMYSQQQQYDQAIAQFETALRLQPLHASAEFGLARALQRCRERRCRSPASANLRAPHQDQRFSAHNPQLRRAGPLLDRTGGHNPGTEGRGDDPGEVRRAASWPCHGYFATGGDWQGGWWHLHA